MMIETIFTTKFSMILLFINSIWLASYGQNIEDYDSVLFHWLTDSNRYQSWLSPQRNFKNFHFVDPFL